MSLFMSNLPLRGGLKPTATQTPPVSALSIPEMDRGNWFFALGTQALKEGLWAIARGCFRTCIHNYGDCMAVRYNLALCELATGQPRQALDHLARAEALQPDDADVLARLIEIAAIELQWAGLHWFVPENARDNELSLEPLGERHLPALHWQLRDPSIARRANLAPMADRAAVNQWYNTLQTETQQRYHYAIMHQSLGFCGLIGGNLDDELAWLYIWLGSDCQQQGLGPRALNLARTQLQQAGVEQILTATWPDNEPSHKALARGGFSRLNAQGYAGPDPVQLWHSPLQESAHWSHSNAMLQEQIDRLGAGFEVRPGKNR